MLSATAGFFAAVRRHLARMRQRAPGATPERHLWLLTTAFPPSSNAGAYRPFSFARYAPDHGWRVSVFTFTDETHGSATLLARLSASTAVRRVEQLVPARHWRSQGLLEGGLQQFETMLAELAEAASDPPSVVLATGPRFNLFVAARLAARALSAPYVLDYRDEWTLAPFAFVAPGPADRWLERWALRGAARVLFTTRPMLDHAAANLGSDVARCGRVLPNGWDAEDIPEFGEPAPGAKGAPRTLLFAGALSGHIAPASFLDDLAAALALDRGLVSQLRVAFMGRVASRFMPLLDKFEPAGVIERRPPVPREAVHPALLNAGALLLISNADMERYLPSKLFDYLAARRPILIHGPGGTAGEIVSELQVGREVPQGDPAALATALRAFVNGDLRIAGSQERFLEWMTAHRRDRLAAELFADLNAITGAQAPSRKRAA